MAQGRCLDREAGRYETVARDGTRTVEWVIVILKRGKKVDTRERDG